jgi:hypothetical protein
VLTRYMDGRKDGWTDRVIPIYPPNFVCGRYEKLLNSYICHSGCANYCNCLFLFSGLLGRMRGGLRLTT